MLNFVSSNIKFARGNMGTGLKITGEIRNCMINDFSSVVFRITVFLNNLPMSNTTMVINAFASHQCHAFEKDIDEIDYFEGLEKRIRCEIYAETAY